MCSITVDLGIISTPELRNWLAEEGNDKRELIVAVRLPERRVVFKDGPLSSRRLPIHTHADESSNRQQALAELAGYLSSECDLSTTVLQNAGALIVSATPAQVRCFIDHPLVKAIHPNRRLMSRR